MEHAEGLSEDYRHKLQRCHVARTDMGRQDRSRPSGTGRRRICQHDNRRACQRRQRCYISRDVPQLHLCQQEELQRLCGCNGGLQPAVLPRTERHRQGQPLCQRLDGKGAHGLSGGQHKARQGRKHRLRRGRIRADVQRSGHGRT